MAEEGVSLKLVYGQIEHKLKAKLSQSLRSLHKHCQVKFNIQLEFGLRLLRETKAFSLDLTLQQAGIKSQYTIEAFSLAVEAPGTENPALLSGKSPAQADSLPEQSKPADTGSATLMDIEKTDISSPARTASNASSLSQINRDAKLAFDSAMQTVGTTNSAPSKPSIPDPSAQLGPIALGLQKWNLHNRGQPLAEPDKLGFVRCTAIVSKTTSTSNASKQRKARALQETIEAPPVTIRVFDVVQSPSLSGVVAQIVRDSAVKRKLWLFVLPEKDSVLQRTGVSTSFTVTGRDLTPATFAACKSAIRVWEEQYAMEQEAKKSKREHKQTKQQQPDSDGEDEVVEQPAKRTRKPVSKSKYEETVTREAEAKSKAAAKRMREHTSSNDEVDGTSTAAPAAKITRKETQKDVSGINTQIKPSYISQAELQAQVAAAVASALAASQLQASLPSHSHQHNRHSSAAQMALLSQSQHAGLQGGFDGNSMNTAHSNAATAAIEALGGADAVLAMQSHFARQRYQHEFRLEQREKAEAMYAGETANRLQHLLFFRK